MNDAVSSWLVVAKASRPTEQHLALQQLATMPRGAEFTLQRPTPLCRVNEPPQINPGISPPPAVLQQTSLMARAHGNTHACTRMHVHNTPTQRHMQEQLWHIFFSVCASWPTQLSAKYFIEGFSGINGAHTHGHACMSMTV